MDRALLELLNRTVASPRLDDLMLLLSTAGLVILPGVGLWMLLQPRHRRTALALLGALLTSLALTLVVQVLVQRPRPMGVRLVLPTPPLSAYPSGHAALAWCAAALLSLTHRRRAVLAASAGVAALITLSRAYLGHHHPSDLLGGALLGASVGVLFHGLWLAEDRALRGRWMLWPQLALVLMVTQMAYLGLLPRGWSLGLPGADKALHFTLFGLLAFWLHLWLGGRRLHLGRWRPPVAPTVLLGAAALEELAQLLSPRRSADPLDLLCDLAGMLVFTWLADRVLARRAQHA